MKKMNVLCAVFYGETTTDILNKFRCRHFYEMVTKEDFKQLHTSSYSQFSVHDNNNHVNSLTLYSQFEIDGYGETRRLSRSLLNKRRREKKKMMDKFIEFFLVDVVHHALKQHTNNVYIKQHSLCH